MDSSTSILTLTVTVLTFVCSKNCSNQLFSCKTKVAKQYIWYKNPLQGSIIEPRRYESITLSTWSLQLLTTFEMLYEIYIGCIRFVLKWSYLLYDVIASRRWRHRFSLMTSSRLKAPHPKSSRKIVRTMEFREKNNVNNNCQLYHALLTYYINCSVVNLSHFPNYTFVDIEWAIVDMSAPTPCKSTKKLWKKVPIIISHCRDRSQNLADMVLMTYPLGHFHCWHNLNNCNYI